MNKDFFQKDQIKLSDYPPDYIPNEAKGFIGFDPASTDSGCFVKGFYKNGEYHIQNFEFISDRDIK